MVETAIAVDDAYTFAFEVRKIVESVEDSVAQAALPRRRAHAIEEQGIFPFRRRWIVTVVACVNLHPGLAAFVELLEERPEPVRMLVVNGDRFFQLTAVALCFVTHETSASPVDLLWPRQKRRSPERLGFPLSFKLRQAEDPPPLCPLQQQTRWHWQARGPERPFCAMDCTKPVYL